MKDRVQFFRGTIRLHSGPVEVLSIPKDHHEDPFSVLRQVGSGVYHFVMETVSQFFSKGPSNDLECFSAVVT